MIGAVTMDPLIVIMVELNKVKENPEVAAVVPGILGSADEGGIEVWLKVIDEATVEAECGEALNGIVSGTEDDDRLRIGTSEDTTCVDKGLPLS